MTIKTDLVSLLNCLWKSRQFKLPQSSALKVRRLSSLLRWHKNRLRRVGCRQVTTIIQIHGEGDLSQLFIKFKAAIICRRSHSAISINCS